MNEQELLGLTEEEAVEKVQSAGLRARVRRRDLQSFMGTHDHVMNRVNLEVDEGKVTGAYFG